jgi:hypothetical protein
MHAREHDVAQHVAVTLPVHPLVAPQPVVASLRAEHARKRAELDATLERLLLMPPGLDAASGPFAREYDALAERRRALSAELAALESALRDA